MTNLVFIILVFLAVGIFFLFFHMLLGSFIRPSRPDTEKLSIYECGEPTVGSAWMQFDIRYYVVALLFVIFDVEVAFFFPWAVVFGSLNEVSRHPAASEMVQEKTKTALAQISNKLPGEAGKITPEAARSWAWVAFADIMVFFGVLLVGFAYLWRRGDIDWVRSTASEDTAESKPDELPILREPVGTGSP